MKSIIALISVTTFFAVQAVANIESPADYERKMKEAKEKCKAGDAGACHVAGVYVSEDDKEQALEFYRMSCDGNYAIGCYRAGYHFYNKGTY